MAHTLVGAALAETGLKKHSRLATATLIVGANLPDIDAATMFISGDAALYFRRGHTHGILAMLVLPLLLAAAIYLWQRWRGASRESDVGPPFRPIVILALAFVAVWSHPLLDWLNTYGVRLLMPFDGSWFYGDTLFIIDPWLWLLAASGIVLARSRNRQALAGWVILLAVTSGLVLGAGFVSGGAKLLWLLGLVAIVGLRLRPGSDRAAVAVARGGLVVLLLYIGTAYTLARAAESALRERLPQASVVQANPAPGNPLAHRLLAVEPGQYRILSPDGDVQRLPRREANQAVLQALASPSIRGFSNWMRFPYWEVEESVEAWSVSIWDLRYQLPGQPAVSGIGFVRVLVPKPVSAER